MSVSTGTTCGYSASSDCSQISSDSKTKVVLVTRSVHYEEYDYLLFYSGSYYGNTHKLIDPIIFCNVILFFKQNQGFLSLGFMVRYC